MYMQKNPFVYIMSNHNNRVLYTGVTSNLKKRVYQHKMKTTSGFAMKYNICKLVYYESCETMETAIAREKQIKSWSRARKVALIDKFNKGWEDLYETM